MTEKDDMTSWKVFDLTRATRHARFHHGEILRMIGDILSMSDDAIIEDVTGVRNRITTLTGRLMFHLFVDDNVIFRQHEVDPVLVDSARKGTHAAREAIRPWLNAYSSPSQIRASVPGFRAACESIHSALEEIFAREESGIYLSIEKAQ